ncbi:TIGR03085 family metal-binding protein [Spirilliplanes yamanashiensis]|uniref:TIGR03085 family protein n=1 Tax=Spirilliplanes yamanashiensis TaxID=42233 RepID=A0A8J3Y8H0_9ACTN|nr:TIGR03085 family metal-binding protein [Spirilliplanes yamanashiensis]MDP9817006.1 uncharacterized protein (TIGR03085 family) [Spirilliplanes yamanashiensis]GIJ03337.1 TIGR03085 family protein [Spirilliplanes yamanashiensis]
MTYARDERRALADLFAETGPDRPTLCEGWTTRDLAAHLVVRDRRPDSAAGLLVPALQAHGERVRLGVAARPWAEVIELVRTPPWWSPVSNPLVEPLTNTTEFFVHHEDVRRGEPGWQPRALEPAFRETLWKQLKQTARLALRKAPARITLVAPGLGETVAGPEGRPPATLTGEPGELLLFLTGRQRAARVEVGGDPAVAERLRGAKLGF